MVLLRQFIARILLWMSGAVSAAATGYAVLKFERHADPATGRTYQWGAFIYMTAREHFWFSRALLGSFVGLAVGARLSGMPWRDVFRWLLGRSRPGPFDDEDRPISLFNSTSSDDN